ncbi:MAG: 2-amino-4-hydroxy-6-hydroxymethyldihydropteridine diphosphokinase [Pseudomonadota bacterium]
MPGVYLGLGSNVDRERNLLAGLDALDALFGEMALSSVYDSETIGYQGDAFLNMVIAIDTVMPLAAMAARLRQIEVQYGRPPDARRDTPRQLDIDILTYGDRVGVIDGVELPRGEILENAFVLCPLAELAPNAKHPVTRLSYAQLWQEYDRSEQRLARIDFRWRGRLISVAGALPI